MRCKASVRRPLTTHINVFRYASTHASTGFRTPNAPEAGPSAPLEPLTASLAELVAECRPFYALLAKHALRPPTLATPPVAPAPQLVDVSGGGAAGGAAPASQHQGATHSYVPDARNETVLVGAWVPLLLAAVLWHLSSFLMRALPIHTQASATACATCSSCTRARTPR
jgi:hypothetical protein